MWVCGCVGVGESVCVYECAFVGVLTQSAVPAAGQRLDDKGLVSLAGSERSKAGKLGPRHAACTVQAHLTDEDGRLRLVPQHRRPLAANQLTLPSALSRCHPAVSPAKVAYSKYMQYSVLAPCSTM